MNITSMSNYRFPQRLYPLNLLAQLKSRKMTGCLRVAEGSTIWSIYLEEGDLIYASNSSSPFERLDRHLTQMSRQVPSLVSAVRVQLRLLFENQQAYQTALSADFRAIYWLVEQQYLQSEQAASLIEAIAKEVITSFLAVNRGSYEQIEREYFDQWLNLGRFDLPRLVDQCQQQVQSQTLQEESDRPKRSPLNPIAPDRGRFTQPQPTDSFQSGNARRPSSVVPGSTGHPSDESMRPPLTKLSKQHYTVVCIDDSPTVLRSISTFLDDAMFSVVMINDPVKALMQIVRSKPDLILLDVTMPNLDGYELCSLLRRHPSFKNTPVVMVTGNTGFIDRAKARLVGASSYLTKPFTQSELLKTVFKHLT